MPLTVLPVELLLQVLDYSSPQDLLNVSQTCRRCQSAAWKTLPCLQSKDPIYFFENSYHHSSNRRPSKNELLISTPRRESTLVPFLWVCTVKSIVGLRIRESSEPSGSNLRLLGSDITDLCFGRNDISNQSFGRLFSGIQALKSFSFTCHRGAGISWDSQRLKNILLRYFRDTLERLKLYISTPLADQIIYIGPLTDFRVLKCTEMTSCMAIRHDAVQKFHDIFPRSIERVKLKESLQRQKYRVEYTYGSGNEEEFFADLHQLRNHSSLYRLATSYHHRCSDTYVWDKTLPSLASSGFCCREGYSLHSGDRRLALA